MGQGVQFDRVADLLADDEGEVAFVVVEVRLEAGDGEVFGEFEDGVGHAEWGKGNASEGGTCFLNVICAEGASRLGYISYARTYIFTNKFRLKCLGDSRNCPLSANTTNQGSRIFVGT